MSRSPLGTARSAHRCCARRAAAWRACGCVEPTVGRARHRAGASFRPRPRWAPLESAADGGSGRGPAGDGGPRSCPGRGDELVIDFDTTGRRVFSRGRRPDPDARVQAGRPPPTPPATSSPSSGSAAGRWRIEAVVTADALPGARGKRRAGRSRRPAEVGGAAPPGSDLEVWLGTPDAEVLRPSKGPCRGRHPGEPGVRRSSRPRTVRRVGDGLGPVARRLHRADGPARGRPRRSASWPSRPGAGWLATSPVSRGGDARGGAALGRAS